MGADFIFTVIRWPYRVIDGVEQSITSSPELAQMVRAEIKEQLAEIDPADAWAYSFSHAIEQGVEEGVDWREQTLNWIGEWTDYVFGEDTYPRDASWMTLDGKDYVISGDMSWGDTPESYDIIAAMIDMGITEEPYEIVSIKND